MPPIRPQRPTGIPGLEWITTDDGSLTLWDCTLGETYHSGCGAMAESMVVYLHHSSVMQRLMQGQATRLFEVGLGTGTNFLLTAALAERFETPLEYWALDSQLVPSGVVHGLQLEQHVPRALVDNSSKFPAIDKLTAADFQSLAHLTESYGGWMDRELSGQPVGGSDPGSPLQYASCRLTDRVVVHVLIGDGTHFPNYLNQATRLSELNHRFNAVYFDAFSPETSPQLWTRDVLASNYELLAPGGMLTSYCVKSRVRQVLTEIGFAVERVPGPVGGKREVLCASKLG